jgi:DNA polymerase-4
VRPEGVAAFMEALPVGKIPGIGGVMTQKLAELGVETCGQLQAVAEADLAKRFGKFGREIYERCRGIDERSVETNRERKSLSNERTFAANLVKLTDCRARLEELFSDLCEELSGREEARAITKVFVKLRFADFSRTTVERAGDHPDLEQYAALLAEGWQRRELSKRSVRLLGLGVRFAASGNESRQPSSGQVDQLVLALT